MAALFCSVLLALMSLGLCGEYTVTNEVWFDVEVQDMDGPGQDYKGRFVIAVFGEVTPMTALNFISLARGHKKLHYKNTQVHRIITDFVVQMGDVEADDGTGGRSIYGETFSDEDFIHSHRSPGWVAMANHGPDTNGSQFYITLTKARWLDGKHVVFGKVIQGMDVIETIGSVATDPTTAVPVHKILITDCGVRPLDQNYDLRPDQLDSTDDL